MRPGRDVPAAAAAAPGCCVVEACEGIAATLRTFGLALSGLDTLATPYNLGFFGDCEEGGGLASGGGPARTSRPDANPTCPLSPMQPNRPSSSASRASSSSRRSRGTSTTSACALKPPAPVASPPQPLICSCWAMGLWQLAAVAAIDSGGAARAAGCAAPHPPLLPLLRLTCDP